jgi:hypothetical protein
MDLGWIIVGVFALGLVALVVSAALRMGGYLKCPLCKARRMRCRQYFMATKINDQGQRYPSTRGYYECSACHARLKRMDGRKEYTRPPDDEWESNVTKRSTM